jgi:hypothetical protein
MAAAMEDLMGAQVDSKYLKSLKLFYYIASVNKTEAM